MEISLTREMEERLNQIAAQAGKGTDEVVQEVLTNYLEHDAWFRQESPKA
jgi:predicted DNA-binding protein